MPSDLHSIGFIGAGAMGEAMIAAIAKSRLIPPERIFATDLRPQRLVQLKAAYGIVPVDQNDQVFHDCRVIVLAVKPQQLNEVLETLAVKRRRPLAHRKLLISIAAGYPIRKIESRIYSGLDAKSRAMMPIVRVMPNTPALVSAGMSGMCFNAAATETDVANARAILETMGSVILFSETELHAVTALSGSGPAYVFYLAESMISAGVELGLSDDQAVQLTLETISGAAKLMALSSEKPGQLRRDVTSPGGTTEAAINILNNGGVRQAFINAVRAAAKRSEELGR